MSPVGGRSSNVEAALRLIGWVARLGTGVSATELAAAAGIPRATCYRLLTSLTADGFLVRVDDLHGFALGRAVEEILGAAVPPFVPAAARELLDDLRADIRFGVHLVVYVGDAVRVADIDPDRPLHSAHLLQRYPHASAAGKLLLAHTDDRRVEGLTPLTPDTTVDPDRLRAELAGIRAAGMARQTGQLTPDVACAAVPIPAHDGRGLAGALCIAGPATRADRIADQAAGTAGIAKALSRLIS